MIQKNKDLIAKLKSNRFIDILKKNNIKVVILFGSHAQGKFHKDSDIDIAVLMDRRKTSKNKLEISRLRLKILKDFCSFLETDKIDLIMLNQVSPLLKYEVARTGLLVYEKEPGDYASFVSLALREQMDARLFYKLDREYLLKQVSNIDF